MSEAVDPAGWVEAERDRLIEELRGCCRVPSIAVDGGPAMGEMADWLMAALDPLLDECELVEVQGAAPAIIGRAAGQGARSVLLYSHYDVQPVEPLDRWTADPFGAEIRDGRIIARGVADDKADVMARIHALQALRATGRPLPCSVVWLCEGGEEIGSPGLGELLRAERDRLQADACLWESYLRDDDGRPEIGFGCRGMVYLELTLRALQKDQHSAFSGVYRSAPTELARALATLVGPDGRATIDGLDEEFVALSETELALASRIPPPPAGDAALPGTSPYVRRAIDELGARQVTEPTVNIAGLHSGHTGPGAKTVLPAEAFAKIDIRTVIGQTPEGVVQRLRAHLDRRGFDDVAIELIHATPAAKSPSDFPLGRAVTEAARERFGDPIVYPMVPGAGPLHVADAALGIPTVMPPGSTRMASSIHGPDEHIAVEDYLAHVAFTVRVLELLGDTPGPPEDH